VPWSRRLKARQVHTGIHYPVPAHLQEACASLKYEAGDFPVTEAAASRILSLPMFAELTEAQIDYVCESVRGNHV
jgi:dTDP-4-amino-4,6-dideoxygalactose transaminase